MKPALWRVADTHRYELAYKYVLFDLMFSFFLFKATVRGAGALHIIMMGRQGMMGNFSLSAANNQNPSCISLSVTIMQLIGWKQLHSSSFGTAVLPLHRRVLSGRSFSLHGLLSLLQVRLCHSTTTIAAITNKLFLLTFCCSWEGWSVLSQEVLAKSGAWLLLVLPCSRRGCAQRKKEIIINNWYSNINNQQSKQ